MSIAIRHELPADVTAIDAVTVAAFRDAEHTSHTEQFIVRALRVAGQLAFSLVAVDGDTIVGHIAGSPVAVSDGALGWYGVGPVSVVPERQRQGIGSRLMEQLLVELRQSGAAGCVLLGDPNFYARFGFRPEPSLVLPDVPPEYFQALSFNGVTPRGTVAYHNAFAAES